MNPPELGDNYLSNTCCLTFRPQKTRTQMLFPFELFSCCKNKKVQSVLDVWRSRRVFFFFFPFKIPFQSSSSFLYKFHRWQVLFSNLDFCHSWKKVWTQSYMKDYNSEKNDFNWSCDTFKGKPPLLLFKHTHNAFLWCRWNYIAHVHVLRSQFAMQTQEITESPFHSKLISAEQVQGCLKERKQ